VSPQVKTILGYKCEEVIGRTPFDFMAPDEIGHVQTEFFKIVADKENINNLLNINLHKDGNRVYLLTSGTPFFNNKGDFLGYRGIDRDTTQLWQKQKEIESMAYYDQLTGLANKNACIIRINEELEYVQRNNFISALLYLDLDGFLSIA